MSLRMSLNLKRILSTLFVAPVVAVLALTASPFWAQSQRPPQVVMNLQKAPQVGVVVALPSGPMAEKAAEACTGCHETRIILQQRLGKAAWTKELDKMTKWGAEVDPKDRDALIEYFTANFGPDQPAYAAQRSAPESKSQNKAEQK